MTIRFPNSTDDQLAEEIALLQEARNATDERLGHLRFALQGRLEAQDARVLPHPTLTVTLDWQGPPKYDPDMVLARLGERLPPGDLAQLVREAYEEVRQIPARVDGTQANRVRRYGGEYAEALDAAMLPRAKVLKVSRKEMTP